MSTRKTSNEEQIKKAFFNTNTNNEYSLFNKEKTQIKSFLLSIFEDIRNEDEYDNVFNYQIMSGNINDNKNQNSINNESDDNNNNTLNNSNSSDSVKDINKSISLYNSLRKGSNTNNTITNVFGEKLGKTKLNMIRNSKFKKRKILKGNNNSIISNNSSNFSKSYEKKQTVVILNEIKQKNDIEYIPDNEQRELGKYNNIEDSASDIEDDNNYVSDNFILLHHSKIIVLWKLFIKFLNIYVCLISIYDIQSIFGQIVYYINPLIPMSFYSITTYFDTISSLFIKTLVDIIFIIEIILNFFTSYVNENENVVCTFKKIAKRYISTWFIFDLLTAIPINFIIYILLYKKYSISLSTTCVLISLKFIRIIKVNKYDRNKNIQEAIYMNFPFLNNYLLLTKFLNLFIYFFIFLHFFSCCWCILSLSELIHGYQGTWIEEYVLFSESIKEKNMFKIYLDSLYFCTITILTVGYGDMLATNSLERCVLSAFILFGSFYYSYILSSISQSVQSYDIKTQSFKKKEVILDDLKFKHKLPDKLYMRIYNLIQHMYYKSKLDQISFIESLPQDMKNYFYLRIFDNQIKTLKFFSNRSNELIISIIPMLVKTKYLMKEEVLSFGDYFEEMFIVLSGVISIKLGYKFLSYEVNVIRQHNHFGDIFLFTNEPSNYNLVTKSNNLDLYSLSKENFNKLKSNYRNEIQEIIKESFIIFMRLEKLRNEASEYYHKHQSFDNFRSNYFQINIFDKRFQAREKRIKSNTLEEKRREKRNSKLTSKKESQNSTDENGVNNNYSDSVVSNITTDNQENKNKIKIRKKRVIFCCNEDEEKNHQGLDTGDINFETEIKRRVFDLNSRIDVGIGILSRITKEGERNKNEQRKSYNDNIIRDSIRKKNNFNSNFTENNVKLKRRSVDYIKKFEMLKKKNYIKDNISQRENNIEEFSSMIEDESNKKSPEYFIYNTENFEIIKEKSPQKSFKKNSLGRKIKSIIYSKSAKHLDNLQLSTIKNKDNKNNNEVNSTWNQFQKIQNIINKIKLLKNKLKCFFNTEDLTLIINILSKDLYTKQNRKKNYNAQINISEFIYNKPKIKNIVGKTIINKKFVTNNIRKFSQIRSYTLKQNIEKYIPKYFENDDEALEYEYIFTKRLL